MKAYEDHLSRSIPPYLDQTITGKFLYIYSIQILIEDINGKLVPIARQYEF
jgi:hypothetical protein